MRIKFQPLPILKIEDETSDAYTVFFPKPEEEYFSYKPGQYLTLKLKVGDEELRRAFSLSSSPVSDDHLSVTIKRVEGGRASNYIRDHYKVGQEIEVLPPMGNFKAELHPENHKNYILIGAGSGITPLMSILKSALQGEPDSVVTLWYCNRDEESIIFKDQLAALSEQYGDRLNVYHSLTRPSEAWNGPQGRLDRGKIYELLSKLFMTDEHRKIYYLCGPNAMMDEAEAALEKHAVNPADVHREYYSAPAPTDQEVNDAYTEEEVAPESNKVPEGYEMKSREVKVELDGKVHSLTIEPEARILDVAIEAKLDPPFACQSGICTTCRALLRSGVVSLDEAEGLSEEELEEGFILTCQAHPLSDDVDVVFG